MRLVVVTSRGASLILTRHTRTCYHSLSQSLGISIPRPLTTHSPTPGNNVPRSYRPAGERDRFTPIATATPPVLSDHRRIAGRRFAAVELKVYCKTRREMTVVVKGKNDQGVIPQFLLHSKKKEKEREKGGIDRGGPAHYRPKPSLPIPPPLPTPFNPMPTLAT